MGSIEERAWRAEESVWANPEKLTPELRKVIEQNNPCFRELGMKPSAPGELIVQDTCFITRLKREGKVNLLIAVDAYCSYGFAELVSSKSGSTPAWTILENVLPLYEEHGLGVKSIMTDEGREFTAKRHSDYDEALAELGIEHIRPGLRSFHDNGHIARFREAIIGEFFHGVLGGNRETSWSDFHHALNRWVFDYNHNRVHRGFPNMGKPPIDFITGHATRQMSN